MATADKIDRLKSQLIISGLQQSNPPLFQVVDQLIQSLRILHTSVSDGGSSGGGGGTSVINQFSGLTIPLPSVDNYERFEYSDSPYPPVGLGNGVTIINNNNIVNIQQLQPFELSIDDRYSDNPYPSLENNNKPIPVPSVVNITDDNTTNATMYPVWVTANSGSLPLKVSSTGLNWNPTGNLTAPVYNGNYLVLVGTGGILNSQITDTKNSLHTFTLINGNAGTIAASAFRFGNDIGNLGIFRLNSSGYTFVAADSPNIANGVSLVGSGTGGLRLGATNAAGILSIFTGGSAAANERMTILANGNVGIGNTSPTVPLHVGSVAGTANRDLVFFGGTVTPSAFGSQLSVRTGTINAAVNNNASVVFVDGTIVIAGSGTHPIFAGLRLSTLSLTAGAGTVTEASTFRIDSAPTGATNNYALNVVAGTSIFGGNVGIGVTAPTAVLHLKAGTATANTAPFKFNAGTLLTAAEIGALEFTDDGTTAHIYGTVRIAGVVTRVQIV